MKTNLILENQHNIKNSIELTKQLNKIQLTTISKLISLDIKDMYTNIPTDKTVNIICNQLNMLDKSSQFIKQLSL